MLLAEWAVWYDSCGKLLTKKSHEVDIDDYPLETNMEDDDEEQESCKQKKAKDPKPELYKALV